MSLMLPFIWNLEKLAELKNSSHYIKYTTTTMHKGPYMSAHVLLNLPVLNLLQKEIKCSARLTFYLFFRRV